MASDLTVGYAAMVADRFLGHRPFPNSAVRMHFDNAVIICLGVDADLESEGVARAWEKFHRKYVMAETARMIQIFTQQLIAEFTQAEMQQILRQLDGERGERKEIDPLNDRLMKLTVGSSADQLVSPVCASLMQQCSAIEAEVRKLL